MAKTLTQIGIETGNVVEAYHVSQSIDAFTGVEAYDISLSGSFNMTGLINGQPGVINPLTASWAITASYAENAGGGAGFPFTGSAQITGSLGLTGSFGINKNISFISGSDLPSAVGATAVYAGGYTTPNIGRLFIGDNTGWQFHFSRISGSIPADIVTIRDKGQVIISNSSASGAFRVAGDIDNPAIFSGVGEGLFAGTTPKYSLESNLGSSAYNHLLVMRGSYLSGSAATRRNGIVFKMSSESDPNESGKMGAVYLESTEGFSNNPSLCFATYNNERMRIDIYGNVGIGKTSPSAKLDVNGNAIITGSMIIEANSTAAGLKITQTGTGNAFTVEDAANDASPFIIDGSGNVAIGKSTATVKLDVSGNANIDGDLNITNGKLSINTGNTTTNQTAFQVVNSNSNGFYVVPNIGGVFNYFTISAAGDVGIIGTTGENFIIGAGNGAAWKFLGNSDPVEDGKMYTNANVGIGVSNPIFKLQLGSDSANKPGSAFWDNTSDQRLKENIEEANYDTCYNIIKNLPLKRYTWKNEVYTTEQVKDRSKLGWIAQDVEIVFPKAVTTNTFSGSGDFYIEDCKSLNADQIYAAMYGTVKKLITENETLQTRITTLESELQAIKTHLGL